MTHSNQKEQFCWEELKKLTSIIKKIALSKDINEIKKIAIRESRVITNSDVSTFVVIENDFFHYQDEDSTVPLFQGFKVPINKSIFSLAIDSGEIIFIKNIHNDPRSFDEIHEKNFVKSILIVPIFFMNSIGAIGIFWYEETTPSSYIIQLLQTIANVTTIAIEKANLSNILEEKVKERTAQLQYEVEQRKKIEEELRQQTITDSLTGLLNRRGFFMHVEQEFKIAQRMKIQSAIMFADLDGLKRVNDYYGHADGDEMIVNAAKILTNIFRSSDVLARLGGDEFAAFTLNGSDLNHIRERIDKAIEEFNRKSNHNYLFSISIGLIPLDPNKKLSLNYLLKKADIAMYEDKQKKKLQSINKDGDTLDPDSP